MVENEGDSQFHIAMMKQASVWCVVVPCVVLLLGG